MDNTESLLTHAATVATGDAPVNYHVGPHCDRAISYPMRMRGGLSVPDGVSEYVRMLIRQWQREGKSLSEIGKTLEISKTQVINVRDETRGVGPRLERTVAQLLHKGSFDALRKEARKFAPQASERDSYPERASALRRLAGLLYPEVEERLRERRLRPGARASELAWIRMAVTEQERAELEDRPAPPKETEEPGKPHLKPGS